MPVTAEGCVRGCGTAAFLDVECGLLLPWADVKISLARGGYSGYLLLNSVAIVREFNDLAKFPTLNRA